MAKQKTLTLEKLYGADALTIQEARYKMAINAYESYFGKGKKENYRIFSAPGRAKICGSHTDHNNGKVFAASINLDIIAIVEPIEANKIAIKSEGFEENGVWLENLDVQPEEANTANALIRGIVKGFLNRGFCIGGFKAYTVSAVPVGSGLSSSAAFEVLVGTILSHLYNNGVIDPVKIAQIGKYAENIYFGKQCHLVDQIASAAGGFVSIDFKDNDVPVVQNINLNFSSFGHHLCIVETGDPYDLTEDYNTIVSEMKQVADFYGVKKLRQILRQDIVLNITELRREVGDRAVLRALHFFDENDRVSAMAFALKEENFDDFLYLVSESGNSSYKYLQSVYSSSDVTRQEMAVGQYVANSILKRKGAVRIHGEGVTGTLQAFVPSEFTKRFRLQIERIFGAGSCHVLTVRPFGAVELDIS
ncbi:MAG: galactokinase [Eubacterium sp.]|jgi:galactokinase|nr:galactokinase [Eubacterium sp.]